MQESIDPGHNEKKLLGLKADRSINRITFIKYEAFPGDFLIVTVPKLNKYELMKSGSLMLRFDVDLSGGDPGNFLVDNISRALVDNMKIKFGGQMVNEIENYDVYKIYEDLYLPIVKRNNMLTDGIQTLELNKIRCNSNDKPTSGVDKEKKLNEIYGSKYCIRLDHGLLEENGAFYPHALREELSFEIKLAAADKVVRGPDSKNLHYRLSNIQLQYEVIKSRDLAQIAEYYYENGKSFTFDHIHQERFSNFSLPNDGRST